MHNTHSIEGNLYLELLTSFNVVKQKEKKPITFRTSVYKEGTQTESYIH